MIEAAIGRRQPQGVARRMKAWESGRAVLRRCGADRRCLEQVLDDPNADWFAREIAAMNLARASRRGDANVAERIAAAYSVRNADARVTMAWLAAHVMQGERCPSCAERLFEVLAQERDTRLPKEFQLSVLMARYSIARLREPTSHVPGR